MALDNVTSDFPTMLGPMASASFLSSLSIAIIHASSRLPREARVELILYNVGPVTFAQVESAIFSSSSATSAGFDFLAGTVLFLRA